MKPQHHTLTPNLTLQATRDKLQVSLLRAIVGMCRSRITTRARVRVNDESKQKRFHVFITGMVEDLGESKEGAASHEFQEAIAALGSQMQECCRICVPSSGAHSAQLDEKLLDIINTCFAISHIPDWRRLLLVGAERPRKEMDSDERSAIVKRIEKLSRYKTSAQGLAKLAREYRLVRKGFVKAVRLPNEAFYGPGPEVSSAHGVSLSETFARATPSIELQDVLAKLDLTRKSAEEKFAEDLRSASKEPKIHAEVQLMWYLDTHPGPKRPRVIASHKDACYLCNLFIRSQGMYNMPRSHGRIYPGWSLPATSLDEAGHVFARKLEGRVLERAAEVLGGAKAYCDPCESGNYSTLPSLASMPTVDESEVGDETGSTTSDATTVRPGRRSSQSSSDSSSDVVVAAAEDAAGTAGAPELDVSRGDSAGGASPTAAPATAQTQHEDEVDDDGTWQTTQPGATAILRLAPKLRVHISYSQSLGAAQPRRRLRFRASELSPAQMTAMDAAGAETVFDVHRDLGPWRDVLCRPNCPSVCLQVRSSSSQQQTRRFRVELG